MVELSLPEDLQKYLQDVGQFQYDLAQVEYGELRLKSLTKLEADEVKVSLYYTPLAQADPHAEEAGWYVMPAVVLTEPCAEYPDVQFLWLPTENLYGISDIEHQTLQVFPNTVWSDIISDPIRYLNAPWDLKTQLLTYFDPSSLYEFQPFDD
ncbi:MAG: hypothetical protein ACRYFS_16935 [Janthinobacterium lividum]